MKKGLCVFFAGIFCATFLHAQVTLGLMGIGGINSPVTGNTNQGSRTTGIQMPHFSYGGGLYLNYRFFKIVGVQAEVSYTASRGGMLANDSGVRVPYEVSTIDLPVLLTFRLTNIQLVAGPRFSFPIGPMRAGNASTGIKELVPRSWMVGIVAGVDFLFTIKKFGITAGIRYGYDFTPVIPDVITLSELYLKLGFEYRFGT